MIPATGAWSPLGADMTVGRCVVLESLGGVSSPHGQNSIDKRRCGEERGGENKRRKKRREERKEQVKRGEGGRGEGGAGRGEEKKTSKERPEAEATKRPVIAGQVTRWWRWPVGWLPSAATTTPQPVRNPNSIDYIPKTKWP